MCRVLYIWQYQDYSFTIGVHFASSHGRGGPGRVGSCSSSSSWGNPPVARIGGWITRGNCRLRGVGVGRGVVTPRLETKLYY